MTGIKAAAIYARISADATGEALGVQRQLEDCRRLAESAGWMVADEYVDNDVSAFSGKRRPEYERMLADIAEGSRDAVLVYNLDRLTRQPIELEEFARVCDGAGLSMVRTVTSDFDISSDDGLFMARMMAAFAAKESGRKSARMKRKAQQKAEQGLPHVTAQRPFGYSRDGMHIDQAEAAVIVEVVDRYLAGESLRSLATWMDQQGIRTVKGGPWRTPTLRALLRSGRIAGLREHRGEVVAKAVWPPIITSAKRDQVIALMDAKATSGRRTPRRYLLSGMLRCGKCGTRLYSNVRNGYERRYVCSSGPDHDGCGRLTVRAAPVEQILTDAVLFRLDTPDLAQALTGKRDDDRAALLGDEMAEDQRQLDELAQLYADRQITAQEWMTARRQITDRIEATRRQIGRVTGHRMLAELLGTGSQLRDTWANLTLQRQAAIVAAVLDHAVIAPIERRSAKFQPERIQPVWRV
jgi:DNA invertase Pin-like site-specific DNA recombinase